MNPKLIGPMRCVLSALYAIFKLWPVDEHLVVFLSRQSDRVPLDFTMLATRLRQQVPGVKIVIRCACLGSTPMQRLAYIWHLIGDARQLATAQVAVLDSYSIPVSVLKHKPSLFVIQLWHAMGKIKRSGLANLDKPYGRSAVLADQLSMHANNDLVVAGGQAWNQFYRESFGPGDYQLLNVGLPRLDHLLSDGADIRAGLLSRYPQLAEKTVLLYAPTWRASGKSGYQELVDQIDFDRYALIVRQHSNEKAMTSRDARETVIDQDVATIDLLLVCDYLITDYSAIAVEAAAVSAKTLYYLFDYDDYVLNNGLNIDLFGEMPGCVYKNAADLMGLVRTGAYSIDALKRFANKYLPDKPGHATEAICDVIAAHLDGV